MYVHGPGKDKTYVLDPLAGDEKVMRGEGATYVKTVGGWRQAFLVAKSDVTSKADQRALTMSNRNQRGLTMGNPFRPLTATTGKSGKSAHDMLIQGATEEHQRHLRHDMSD